MSLLPIYVNKNIIRSVSVADCRGFDTKLSRFFPTKLSILIKSVY